MVSETHKVSRTGGENRRVSRQRNSVIRAVSGGGGGGAAEDGNKALVSNRYVQTPIESRRSDQKKKEAWEGQQKRVE